MSHREERSVAIPLEAGLLALEGVYVAGTGREPGGAVIAPPHPLYGGSMDSPVVNEIAWGCRKCGVASLRFNWRGVGASGGEPSGDDRDADADYAAALDELEASVAGGLFACGYSFGAAAAARAAAHRPQLRGLVLVAPPPALLEGAALERYAGPVLLVTGEDDDIAPAAELEEMAARCRAARLVVVPEADHFFVAGLAQVSRAVADWLERPAD